MTTTLIISTLSIRSIYTIYHLSNFIIHIYSRSHWPVFQFRNECPKYTAYCIFFIFQNSINSFYVLATYFLLLIINNFTIILNTLVWICFAFNCIIFLNKVQNKVAGPSIATLTKLMFLTI